MGPVGTVVGTVVISPGGGVVTGGGAVVGRVGGVFIP